MKLALNSPANSLPACIAFACLANMLSGNHFSICAVEDAANVAQTKLTESVKVKLSALHCVPWNLMAEPVRQYILGVCDSIVEQANQIS